MMTKYYRVMSDQFQSEWIEENGLLAFETVYQLVRSFEDRGDTNIRVMERHESDVTEHFKKTEETEGVKIIARGRGGGSGSKNTIATVSFVNAE